MTSARIFWPVDPTWVSCIAGRVVTIWVTRESLWYVMALTTHWFPLTQMLLASPKQHRFSFMSSREERQPSLVFLWQQNILLLEASNVTSPYYWFKLAKAFALSSQLLRSMKRSTVASPCLKVECSMAFHKLKWRSEQAITLGHILLMEAQNKRAQMLTDV